MPRSLRNIFPEIGPVTQMMLFADFSTDRFVPSDEAWRKECETVIGQGLAGVAERVIRERALPVPEDVRHRLQQAHFDGLTATARIVRQSAAGLDALRRAGIPFVVTKGPGFAVQGASMSDRSFIDLDVLVSPSRFSEVRRILAAIGYAEHDRTMPVWDCFNRLCREAINLRAPDGGSIDLHHRVSPWYWSTGMDLDFVGRAACQVEIFGTQLPVAAPEHNALVAALHVVSDKGHPGQTYRAWRDLLVMANSCAVDDLVEAAAEAGLCSWLSWTLQCLPADVQPAQLLAGLAARQQKMSGMWRLRMLLSSRLQSLGLLGQVFRLPASHSVLYAAGMLVPSPRFLRARYPDNERRYLTWWHDVAEELRPLVS